MKFLKLLFVATFKKGKAKEKSIASIRNEPWIDVVEVKMEDPNDPSTGYVELDWNHAFIDSLYNAGYSGRTDADVVDQWFNQLCRGVLADEINND